MKMNDKYSRRGPFLKALRLGVCPKCLHERICSSISDDGAEIYYHCINPDCTEYNKEKLIPKQIYDFLYYLEENQVDLE